MIASGYTLDVYCDFGNERHFTKTKDTFFDESKAVAWRMCRRAGWRVRVIDGERKAMCPACAKVLVKGAK